MGDYAACVCLATYLLAMGLFLPTVLPTLSSTVRVPNQLDTFSFRFVMLSPSYSTLGLDSS